MLITEAAGVGKGMAATWEKEQERRQKIKVALTCPIPPRITLERMYWQEGKGFRAIGIAFGVSTMPVHKWFRLYQIPRRKAGPFILPSREPSPTLSYVLGVHFGDGYCHGGRVRLQINEEAFARSYYNALATLGFHPHIYIRKDRGAWVTTGYSRYFVNWLRELSLEAVSPIAHEYPWDFLRGFYEAEGSSRRRPWIEITMCNSNQSLLRLVSQLLAVAGIPHSFHENHQTYKQKPYTMYYVNILGSSAQKAEFLGRLRPCIKYC